MTQEMLFAMAIGIQKPWIITKIELSVEKSELSIHVDFEKGSLFQYIDDETGEVSTYTAYDTSEKTWRHMNFFQYKCYLYCRIPRIKTKDGKVRQVKTSWEGLSSGFTMLFEALILQFSKVMTVHQLCKMIDTYDQKIWDMLYLYTGKTRETADYSNVTKVGMDETSIHGHEYITTFVDLEERKTLFVVEGKDSSTVQKFVEDLKEHKGNPENITDVSCDLSPAFIKGIRENIPSARITFDKFHLIKILNEAVNNTRKKEAKTNPLLRGSKYIFLKNKENYTKKQQEKYEELKLHELNSNSFKAMEMRETFQQIYLTKDMDNFENLLNKWCDWGINSNIKEIMKVVEVIKNHWKGIINWAKSHITNAILEGYNSVFQAAKAKARGYKRADTIKAICYLLTGKLDFSKINPFYTTHTLL